MIYEAADWPWFLNDQGLLYMCWNPPRGYECPRQVPNTPPWDWRGYNEAMLLYLLALGSRTHPIPPGSWDRWAATYQWGAYYGYPVLIHGPGPLFAHQYPQAWFDLRGKRDAYVNYFRNSRYATLANRAYSRDVWYPVRRLVGSHRLRWTRWLRARRLSRTGVPTLRLSPRSWNQRWHCCAHGTGRIHCVHARQIDLDLAHYVRALSRPAVGSLRAEETP